MRIAMIGVRGLATDPPSAFRRADSLRVGGAELAAEELSAHLAALGHGVTLYTRGGAAKRDPRGFALKPIGYIPGRGIEALSHSFAATLSALAKDFDLLHFHAVGPSGMALLARARGRPAVVTVQGLDWQRQKWSGLERRVLRSLARIGLGSASAVIAVAPSLLEPLRALGAGRVSIVPNGCSITEEASERLAPPSGLPAGAYLLAMSRLVPEKNLHGVIRAYRSTDVPWPLAIAGGSADTPDHVALLRREAEGCDRIRFLGPVSGQVKEALLRNAGGLVNASFLEGLSLGILEALGAGIPVAVSSIPANLDVFSLAPGVPASLPTFPPEDPAQIAAAMVALTRLTAVDREEWRRYATVVRDTFAWPRIAERTVSIYEDVLSGIRA